MVAAWVPIDVDAYDDEPPPTIDGWAVLLRAIDERRPAWQAEAACARTDPALFFPERGASTEPAKAICGACPVVERCRLYAEAEGFQFGVWAGFSASTLHRRRYA